jgi:hypothetical protein
VNRSASMRLAFAVGVLVVTTFALAGCGGTSQEKAEARPLPKESKGLEPGEYRSEKFEPPVSFRVNKGWLAAGETSGALVIKRSNGAGIGFMKVQGVYKPVPEADKASMPTLVKAPEDLVGWFQDHPYLKVEGLEPITVGGIEGRQFTIVADVPKDLFSMCGADCVDAIEVPVNGPLAYYEGEKLHAIVLDVKGETVYIDYGGPSANFYKMARKVLDSVEWKGA